MKRITLSNGGEVVVDDQDYEWLCRWKWKRHTAGYASRNSWRDGHWVQVYMHRLIVGASPGTEVDHINQDKLDNRRENLRVVPRYVNMHNRPLRSDNTSGHRGVQFRGKKWVASIWVDGTYHHLGSFQEQAAAISAYEEASRRLVPQLAAAGA